MAAAVGIVRWTGELERRAQKPLPVTTAPRWDAASARVPALAADLVPEDVQPAFPATVERGQTVSGLFRALGLESHEVLAATRATLEHLDARQLRAGSRYAVTYADQGGPVDVAFDVGTKGRLHVRRVADADWRSEWQAFRRSRRLLRAEGDLEGSLLGSLEHSGADPTLAFRMERVLQWDLDFHRDLREGDRFEVLYEELLLDGRPAGIGEVLALRYRNRDRWLEAYRYGESGHYDADGRPLRKRFLRSPMRFSRITSGFSTRRFHPINRRMQPHWGVDYGAPVGTPVFATASGVVESAGWNGGGGKTVKLRHPNGYLTAYLHLSRFADGVRAGARVSQGETVGYVGSTGLATGPHLDYRVQKNGRWINPASLASEPAPPIPPAEIGLFEDERDRLRTLLASSGPLPVLPDPETSLPGPVAGGS